VVNSNHPSWNQTFVYTGIIPEDLRSRVLEVTVWDYDRFGSNEFLGEIGLDLGNIASNQFAEEPLWHYLNLHENAGGDLKTVPPICHTPGPLVRGLLET
jgi:regulating synaptic membrane exocytosis protein 2